MGRIIIKFILFYQKHLSLYLRGTCIYSPSCSQYTIEAVQKYGAFRGISLGFHRILRCRPNNEGGHDPLK